MEKLDPKTDGASPNIVDQNIEKLLKLFPEAFTEGSDEHGPSWKVDFNTLREILGGYVEEQAERYSFTWNGKARARRIAQTPSTGTLRPCPEESVNWDTTQNLFIEGDNLEVLKVLQKSYHKKVKMIYIDPPYNTGNDFIYPDDFRDNIRNYMELTRQTDEAGRKLSTNSEISGRYHTNWLNMMYPRLKLARNLLCDDGVIFISIDDNEFANVRKLCDEVFGEENFIGEIIWQTATDNNATQIAIEHEYVLCFAKIKSEQHDWTRPSDKAALIIEEYNRLRDEHGNDIESISSGLRSWINSAKQSHSPDISGVSHYSYVDAKGVYYPGNSANTKPGGYNFDIIHPETGGICAKPGNGYRWPEKTFLEAAANGDVHWGEDHTTVPKIKKRIETAAAMLKSVYYEDNRVWTNRLTGLMGAKVFDNPKSVKLLYTLASFITHDDDTILDFFAGSCSTAQAALGLDVELFDKARRRFILVQLPEAIDATDKTQEAAFNFCKQLGMPTTISEIGKERIRRVIKKLETERAEKAKEAQGSLLKDADASNIKPWDADFDNLETALFDAVENIKPDRTEEDVLYELLLKYGLDLAEPIEEREIDGRKAYIIGAGALIVCLAKNITLDVVEGIAALKEELKPEIMRVVFKDSGFADDVVKTNAVQILRRAGVEDVKSL